MIAHCVFLKYRADVAAAEKAEIHAGVLALKSRIAGLVDIRISGNVSPEGLGKGYTDGFIVTFQDAASRDRYLVDEEHQKVGGRIVSATEGGVDGVFVYDLEY